MGIFGIEPLKDNLGSSFAFIILAYNHENFIIEHLESIKFLIQRYGRGIDVDLVVTDDFSRDRTCLLIDRWLLLNRRLFRNVNLLYNQKNSGTCRSLSNALDHVVADRCKITAGDDVYSSENIFEIAIDDDEFSMISGRVLYLRESQIVFDPVTSFYETATEVIYKHSKPLHRFKHFSITNAPNLIYAMACLKNHRVRNFLSQFDVVEDWPLQIAIAREFPQKKVKLIDKVLVYYRRTPGSTYIVANDRFLKDRKKIFSDFISKEDSFIEIIRMFSRKKALGHRGKIASKLWNLDTYFFILAGFVRLPLIIMRSRGIKINLTHHRSHYALIKENARLFDAHTEHSSE